MVVAAFCSFIALVINEALNISEHRSCYPIIWIFSTALVLSTRFFYRIVRAMRNMRHDYLSKSVFKNVMIIGAGSRKCFGKGI